VITVDELERMRPTTNSMTMRTAVRELAMFALSSFLLAPKALAEHSDSPLTNIFTPESAPAKSIFNLSMFVLAITGIIFVVVVTLLAYYILKFRATSVTEGREPAQVYGSTQIELAWTIIPILIVVVLFLATARVLHAIQDAPEPAGAVEVTAIGHQYWWEFRYPKLGIVTANELHIPVSDPSHPTPTFVQLLSADTDHSFWVPELAGKTDLIPNHPNRMWMDPHRTDCRQSRRPCNVGISGIESNRALEEASAPAQSKSTCRLIRPIWAWASARFGFSAKARSTCFSRKPVIVRGLARMSFI